MSMYKLLYVDDDELSLTHFRILCEKFSQLSPVIHHDPEAALTECVLSPPDLALLDVEMPGLNGLKLAEELRKMDIPVAFLSLHKLHAWDAFQLDALHYLTKPLTESALRDLLNRFGKRISSRQGQMRQIYINTQKQIRIVHVSDLAYISAEGSYTHFHLMSGEVIISGKHLKNYDTSLIGHPELIRVHRSYIINQQHLSSINKLKDRYQFQFGNGKKIELSSFRREDWTERFF